jgi:Na+-driven multidrug efflux pump
VTVRLRSRYDSEILFNFLTYRVTAQVARYAGAGEDVAAGRIAAQALWLSTGIGVGLTLLLASLAVPLVDLMGGDDRVGDLAVDYLRIGSIGLPFALIALAGQAICAGCPTSARRSSSSWWRTRPTSC